MSRVSKHSTSRWVAYSCFSEFRTLARLTLTACKSAKQQGLTKPVISRRHWVIHPSNSCARIYPALLLVRFSCTELPTTHVKRKNSLSQFWLTFHKSVAGRSCCQTLFPSGSRFPDCPHSLLPFRLPQVGGWPVQLQKRPSKPPPSPIPALHPLRPKYPPPGMASMAYEVRTSPSSTL